jgi:hypothetical protein
MMYLYVFNQRVKLSFAIEGCWIYCDQQHIPRIDIKNISFNDHAEVTISAQDKEIYDTYLLWAGLKNKCTVTAIDSKD